MTQLPSEVTARFEEFLLKKVPAVNFRWLLKETGAIIAGGSALRACYEDGWASTGDIDIYVNVRHVPRVKEALASISTTLHSRRSNLYCNSFLVRNRIREVITLTGHDIDIVCVRNARNVTDVVKNFDLTMCQVWYDGTAMYATHPEHIVEKRGELQGDYIDLYNMGNRFLLNRMDKYRARGFTITLQDAPPPQDKEKPRRHALYPVFEKITASLDDMSGYDSEDYTSITSLRVLTNNLEENIAHALIESYKTARVKFVELCDYIKTSNEIPLDRIIHSLEVFILQYRATYERIVSNFPSLMALKPLAISNVEEIIAYFRQ